MIKGEILLELNKRRKEVRKSLAVLIDPDKTDHLSELLHPDQVALIDFFFVGGSLLNQDTNRCIATIRSSCSVPIILFPGNAMQLSSSADGLLLLSLISGRNADLLIGRHVSAAPLIRSSGLEVISTGYMLIDSGQPTAVNYMSQTMPLPSDKPEIAACTAMAGEQLGLQVIYLEAGSGAKQPVPVEMVRAVRGAIDLPLFVGGGLHNIDSIQERCAAGADVIIIGNALETAPNLLRSFSQAIQTFAV